MPTASVAKAATGRLSSSDSSGDGLTALLWAGCNEMSRFSSSKGATVTTTAALAPRRPVAARRTGDSRRWRLPDARQKAATTGRSRQHVLQEATDKPRLLVAGEASAGALAAVMR